MYQTLPGIYIRVSTQEQAENGYSVDEQTDRLKKYVEAMDWTLYKAYTDAGFSGSNTNRPALQRMIKDVKLGKLNKIIVYKLDRLSRSQKDTLTLIEDVFLAGGCDFVSMSENFDTATPFGRAMIGILAVFAQLEREQITERMMMGKDARAKLGKFHGSLNTPIGYDYINGKLVANPLEKAQIVTAFNLFTSGVPISEIVRQLNAHGKTRYGSWKYKTVRRLLENKTYVGFVRHKDNWYKGEHESLISEETYNSAVSILRKNRLAYEKNSRTGKITSYLGGLLVCAHCGAKYTKITAYTKNKNGETTHKRFYYACSNRVAKSGRKQRCSNRYYRMEELDDLIFSELKKLALDPNGIIDHEQPKDESERINAELSEVDKRIERLLDLYESGSMPVQLLQERLINLQAKKEQLEDELEEEITSVHRTKCDITNVINTVEDVLRLGDFNDIRAILTDLIGKIVIDGEDQIIHWNF